MVGQLYAVGMTDFLKVACANKSLLYAGWLFCVFLSLIHLYLLI